MGSIDRPCNFSAPSLKRISRKNPCPPHQTLRIEPLPLTPHPYHNLSSALNRSIAHRSPLRTAAQRRSSSTCNRFLRMPRLARFPFLGFFNLTGRMILTTFSLLVAPFFQVGSLLIESVEWLLAHYPEDGLQRPPAFPFCSSTPLTTALNLFSTKLSGALGVLSTQQVYTIICRSFPLTQTPTSGVDAHALRLGFLTKLIQVSFFLD